MKLRVGTRGSALALTQTKMVIAALDPSLSIEIIEIKTSGDKKQGTDAARFGDKKDWVYELELALLGGEIDLAVHSGKDLPGNIERGTAILPILSRATPNDIFIGKPGADGKRLRFKDLPHGASVGTASLRRKAALRAHRSDINPEDHRGNVPTRIRKLDESATLSGIILAAAGVERLSALPATDYEILGTETMLPAMNQGILAVQFRSDDVFTRSHAQSISSEALQSVFFCERACAETLEGDCNSAISLYASILDEKLTLSAVVYSRDGTTALHAAESDLPSSYKELGVAVGEMLLKRGAKDLLL